MTRRVVDLAEAREASLVGTKAAVLGRLMTAGLDVPDGFVVCVAPAVDEGWRHEAASSYDDLGARLVTPGGAADVGLAVAVAVAVRSSSPHEDLPERSAASLLPSRLGVRGRGEVVAAIADLRHPSSWEGLASYAEGVFGYGGPSRADAPAVIVQALVRADAAGVAFTAHPVTGERERVLIEVGEGLGDVVTDGLLIPTLIEVARSSGRVVAERPGVQRVSHAFDDAAGVVAERAAVGVPTLSADEARTVWEAALAAEAVVGGPVDVEWALTRTAGATPYRLWVVQARPITTLPA